MISPTNHRADGQTSATVFANVVSYGTGGADAATYHQWVLGLTLTGSNHYRVGEARWTAKAGDIILVRPHAVIQWRVPRAVDEWKTVYAVFHPRPHWLEWLNSFEFQSDSLRLSLQEPLQSRMRHGLLAVARVYHSNWRHRDDYALLALERVLLALYTHVAEQRAALDARVQTALEVLHARFAERWTLRGLADHLRISQSHLSHLFRAALGVTPMQYLERVRLEQAGKLLRFGSLPINQIARDCGYADAEYFAIRFKRATGQTPRDFRRAASTPPP